MFARTHGPRAVITSLATVGTLVPCLLQGCTSSSPGGTANGGDGGYVTVVTAGGGVQATDAGVTDPFSSSSSSGGSGSSGQGIDGGSSGSSGADSGSSSSSGADASDDGGSISFNDGGPYTPPSCDGVNPCSLRSNTCCLAATASGLVGTCVDGTNATCASNQATVHCLQAAECATGLSCCGDVVQLLGQVRSACVSVPEGGNCPYVPATLAQAGVQLCKTDAECKNGQPCVHQTCIYGAVLDICGLQSADAGSPLNCY